MAYEPIEDWLREAAVDPTIDEMKALELILGPGRSIVWSGERGQGKSHAAIGMNELAVKLHPGSVLFTNIIFNRIRSIEPNGYWEPGCHPRWEPRVWPKEVVHVTSLERVFRLTGKMLEEKSDWAEDDNFCIYNLNDEFQNFMMADKSYEPLVQAHYVYEGNLRKFNHCEEKITPSINNIPKRLRRFVDDISYAGYMSAHIQKEKFLVADFNNCWGTHIDPRYFATVKIGYDHHEELMEVPTLTWNKPKPQWIEGDIIYDHKSSATFRLSERQTGRPEDEFDFLGLINAVGGVSSIEVPQAINAFFEKMDGESGYDPAFDPAYQMCVRVREMLRIKQEKGLKLTWADIARIEQKKESTIRMAYQRYAPQLDLDLVEMEQAKEDNLCKT